MNQLTKLYYRTTEPKTPYNKLYKADTILSIILHSLIYSLIVSSFLSFMTTFIILVIIMTIGYYLRLARAKALYEILKNETETREAMNKIYLVWYFLG